jgi:hypothetical protein
MGSVPVGGVIPVSQGFTPTDSDYLLADGTEVTASTYPDISGQLTKATVSSLKQFPGAVNFNTIGYGNGMYIAATRATPTTANLQLAFQLSYSTDGVIWTTKPIVFEAAGLSLTYLYISVIRYLNGAWYLMMTPGETGFNPLATGSGQVVNGGIYRSTDGLSWNNVKNDIYLGYSGASDNFMKGSSLRYLNGVYFAISMMTTYVTGDYNKYFTSTDGLTWTARQPTIIGINYRDIAFNGTTYVIVAAGHTYSSTDYLTWTLRTNAQTAGWTSIAYGNGCFVTVQGFSNTSTTATGYSTDGITWTPQTIPSGRYMRVIYAAGLFVAIGYGVCATSPNGTTWTSRSVPNFNWTDMDYSATAGFVAVANNYNSTTPTVVIQSTDGMTWTSNNINVGINYQNIEYNTSTGFIAIDNSNYFPITSPDGNTWTRTLVSASGSHIACKPDGSMYITLNINTNVAYPYYSTNLTSWTALSTVLVGIPTAMRYLNDRFIIMGNNGTSPNFTIQNKYSKDGINWYTGTFDNHSLSGTGYGVQFYARDLAYGNGIYIAVGVGYSVVAPSTYLATDTRVVAISADGINWLTSAAMPAAAMWGSIAYGNGVFVAMAIKPQRHPVIGGSVSASYFWSLYPGDPTADAIGVTGRIFAVSENGTDWTMGYMPVAGEWNDISFNGHMFIAINGQAKSYAVSSDGYNWVMHAAPSISSWTGIASNTTTNVSVVVSGTDTDDGYVNLLTKYGNVMRITESATNVTLPYIKPENGIQYAVRVK